MDARVWWRGRWWDLWILDENEYETTFIEFVNYPQRLTRGATHVLESYSYECKFNRDTDFKIWYNILEDDAAFLVTLFRIDVHRPRLSRLSRVFNRIQFTKEFDRSETYELTIATHQINAISSKLTGDGSIAARVLRCLVS